MNKKLGILHTSATLVPIFQALCEKHLPGVSVFHMSDDSLIKDVIEQGRLRQRTARRVTEHIFSAEDAGADRILVTCSSIGRAVEAAAQLSGVPVHRVDQPMADLAVSTGNRIGVIATLPTTLDPTADLVRRRAEAAGKTVHIEEKLCEGAFDALMSGDAATHDTMVAEGLASLSREADVILLAQASMARVVKQLETEVVPILASPELAIQHLAKLFSGE